MSDVNIEMDLDIAVRVVLEDWVVEYARIFEYSKKGGHMSESEVDLAKLFDTVTEALKGKKDSLNEADSYNHDHGNNMVENFTVITDALKQKSDAPPSEQLAYASEVLNMIIRFVESG